MPESIPLYSGCSTAGGIHEADHPSLGLCTWLHSMSRSNPNLTASSVLMFSLSDAMQHLSPLPILRPFLMSYSKLRKRIVLQSSYRLTKPPCLSFCLQKSSTRCRKPLKFGCPISLLRGWRYLACCVGYIASPLIGYQQGLTLQVAPSSDGGQCLVYGVPTPTGYADQGE